LVSVLAALGAAVVASVAATGVAEPADPLAQEVSRWSKLLRESASKDDAWIQIKGASQPLIAGAEQALRDGRRLLALQRLASARAYLAAATYVESPAAGRVKDLRGLEAEWTRMGGALRDSLGKPGPGALSAVSPAAARALGEAALSQVRVYYDSSLEYGRNTMPSQGLFYLGLAEAQREFVSFCRTLSPAVRPEPPPVRSLEPELDSLESELLEAYRPPASIDRHAEFIAASSMLKEARELDAAGLRYGALLRYLQAAQRLSLLRKTGTAIGGEALASRLRELDARLSAGGFDDSLGRLFLESAQAEVAGAAPGTDPPAAVAVAGDVLPRYFAALQPASPAAPRPAPEVTVTLVRWPYT
jgi:hypothetical protein